MRKSITRGEFGLVATYLTQLRLNAGWSQTLLAKKLGRTQTFISSLELGFRRVDVVQLYDFLGLFGVTLAQFGRDMDVAFAKASPKKRKPPVRQQRARPRR